MKAELLSDAEIDTMLKEAARARVKPVDPKWDVKRIAVTLDHLRKQVPPPVQHYVRPDFHIEDDH